MKPDEIEYRSILAIADSIGQSHLLKYWDTLSTFQKKHLKEQIEAIDLKTFRQQRDVLKAPQKTEIDLLVSPLNKFSLADDDENLSDFNDGKLLISSGLVGCIVVAGGQGTRLKFEGPKGMCPVTLVKKKSLFQLLCEKTLAASLQAGRELPLAIMTSPINHEETVRFFESQSYFGLNKAQVTFFMQKQLPLLNVEGNMFLESKEMISIGPDGNGSTLYEFYRQGIYDRWKSEGVQFVNFILVDNPLADPFDAKLVGFMRRCSSDVVIKATMRRDAAENVGLIVEKYAKPYVIEYSELKQDDRTATDKAGKLLYPLANMSLFCFKMDFIKLAFRENDQLPLHKAYKSVKYLNSDGKTILASVPCAWKFERFIFDILQIAKKIDVLVYPREECFAPLKNFNGKDSLETVPYALESSDRKVLSEITKTQILITPLEIAQDFYYPTKTILQDFKGRQISEGGYLSV